MATIHNTDLTKELRDGGKLQQLSDIIPSQLADKVVPTMEVNPKFFRRTNIIKRAAATNATAATIYTTPADKEFFLTGASLSVIKDATSTSTSTYIQSTDSNGMTFEILDIPSITLTPQSETISVTLANPILLKKGQSITVNNSTNVANINTQAVIYGYLVDNITA